MKNLEKHVAKVLSEHRLDHYLQEIIKSVPWDDLMMAFSNMCVNHANDKDIRPDSKEYKAWMNRGMLFYKTIIDPKKATVQKRLINKRIIDVDKDQEESDS